MQLKSPLSYSSRVLLFHETKSNLLDALDLLTHASVPSSFITTPSLLSVKMFLSSFKTHLQGDLTSSLSVLTLYTSCVCVCVCVSIHVHTHTAIRTRPYDF